MMKIHITEPDCIPKAIECFKSGGIVVYPTDTCYGLGTIGLKWNDENIAKIYKIKDRDISKPLSLLISKKMISAYIKVPENIQKMLKRVWPGSFTAIIPRVMYHQDLSPLLNQTGSQKIAFRVPNHELLLKIIDGVNQPIIGTSANRSGQQEQYHIKTLLSDQNFKDVDLWIDEGQLQKNLPSTVVDFSDYSNPIVLREGAVKFRTIMKQFL
ncbi:MAG: L-threonylcarbamoyladenylate synthase [Candidatus Hodarchaeales archaeon]